MQHSVYDWFKKIEEFQSYLCMCILLDKDCHSMGVISLGKNKID
jgi:hypothetical protein